MSKYINAEKLEKDGWTMQRTYKSSATEMVCEMKKPTDMPSIDVADASKIIDELSKVPWYNQEDEKQAMRIVKSFFATDSQLPVNENLISREQAIEKVNAYKVFAPTDGVEKTLNAVMDAIARSIAELPPAADVQEVKHGRWKDTEFGWLCSICGQVVGGYTRHNYCPNCGAEMDLGGEMNELDFELVELDLRDA